MSISLGSGGRETESEMEGARRGGHNHSALCTLHVSSMSSSSLPLPALLSFALPCEGLGKNSTESHGSALPSSLYPTARTRHPLLRLQSNGQVRVMLYLSTMPLYVSP
jgi:hypothetical protein